MHTMPMSKIINHKNSVLVLLHCVPQKETLNILQQQQQTCSDLNDLNEILHTLDDTYCCH